MNQQRSRRFRASQEAAEKAENEAKLREEWEKNHGPMPDEEKKKEAFDSNCITPGTPFMSNLAVALRYYVTSRLNTDPGWRNVSVTETRNIMVMPGFFQVSNCLLHHLVENHSVRCQCSRRRRAQNHGLRATAEGVTWIQPKYNPCFVRSGC
jgi:hypothetical protein